MHKLPVIAPLRPRETLISFVSNLAAANGTPTVLEFCNDLKLQWTKVYRSNRDELKRLSVLSTVPLNELAEVSLVGLGDRRYEIAGEIVMAKTLRMHETRVCPQCIAEDFEDGAPFGRIEWQVAAYRTCHKHSVPMYRLPKAIRPRCDFDFIRRVEDHKEAILERSGCLPQASATTSFESYLHRRLSGVRENTWCDEQELGLLVEASEKLGAVLAFGSAARPSTFSEEQEATAFTCGFEAFLDGPIGLNAAFRKIRAASTTMLPGFYTDFGAFARWLGRVDLDNPRFSGLVELVTDFAFRTYPFEKGECFLNRVCLERKIHNTSTLAKAYGISPDRAARLAKNLGLGDWKGNQQSLFDSKKVDPHFAAFSKCMNGPQLAQSVGITKSFVRRFSDAGFVRPRYNLVGMDPVFHPDDIEDFLKHLQSTARRVSEVPIGTYRLAEASSRAKCCLEDVIQLSLVGKLKSLCYTVETPNLRDFYVDREEVLDHFQSDAPDGHTKVQIQKFLRINTTTICLLVDRGLLTCKRIRHHRSRKPMSLIRTSDLMSFLGEHATLGMMANHYGTQAIHVARKLETKDVFPMALGSTMCSKIYLRQKVESSGLAELYLNNWTPSQIEEALS